MRDGARCGRAGSRPAVQRAVRAREQAHRSAILLGIGTLMVLGTSPVFGHHLLSGAEPVLSGRDHIAGLCLIALHELLAPVHFGFHIVLIIGLGYALFDRGRAARGARATLQALESLPPLHGSVIARAAACAGLSSGDVLVVPGLPNPAFTAGWWRPRVYVAAEIVDVLDEEQLTAVLAHERAHLVRRDPLRLSVLRFLACTLFYLPTFRRLAEDAADEAEILADDAAAREVPLVLAETLVLLATAFRVCGDTGGVGPAAIPRFAVGFQRVGLIDRRVRRLLGEDVPIRTHVTLGSLAGAAGLLITIALSGLVMAHPLAAAPLGTVPAGAAALSPGGRSSSDGAHCHRSELAIAHLFCFGFHHHPAGTRCPHRTARG